MSVAQLPEPTPVLKAALARGEAPAFQRALFDWVAKASGGTAQTLWLLNDSFDALSLLSSPHLPLLLDEAVAYRFRQDQGAWGKPLSGHGEALFCLPLHDGKQARGLMEFSDEVRGAAWRRTAGCLIQVYLAQRHQHQERAALEAMLTQMRPKKQAQPTATLSLKTGHLIPLRDQFERTLISDRLDMCGQVKAAAAQSLGITYRSLAQKCKHLGLT